MSASKTMCLNLRNNLAYHPKGLVGFKNISDKEIECTKHIIGYNGETLKMK